MTDSDKIQKRQTYLEQFESALTCETKEEAEHWMEEQVAHLVEHYGGTRTEVVDIIKSNIGYMAGYYDNETAQKIHRLFNAVHPIFGTATYHRDMLAKEAFELGKKLDRRREEGD